MNPHLAAVLCIVLSVATCVIFAIIKKKVSLSRLRKKVAKARADGESVPQIFLPPSV
jgi:hypothetical protein